MDCCSMDFKFVGFFFLVNRVKIGTNLDNQGLVIYKYISLYIFFTSRTSWIRFRVWNTLYIIRKAEEDIVSRNSSLLS